MPSPGPARRRNSEATMGERYAEGHRDMFVEPLDFKILELLPAEGTNIGDLYQIGETANEIGKKLNGQVTSTQVSARLRVLHLIDLVRAVRTLGDSSGRSAAWQRTVKGQEALAEWQAKQ